MVRVSAVTILAAAILVGGAFATGVLVLLLALPRWRAPSLAVRIGPYVREAVIDAALPPSSLPQVDALSPRGRSPWARAVALFEQALGGGDDLKRRLAQAGVSVEPSSFRARQLGWSLTGLIAGSLTVIALVVTERMSPPGALLPVLLGVAGGIGHDMMLSARGRARRARITAQLPTVLEFVALCLSAGEGFLDAVRRVAAVGSGELTAELRTVVLAVGTGSPVADALVEVSGRLQIPGLSRAVDQIVAALEHGAPLAGVLHAQAGDAREDEKRVLIEQAGRKEILMLLPLVFLILPLSVLFAIYPGLFILRLGIG